MEGDKVIPAGRTGFRVKIWVARNEANMLLGVCGLVGLSKLDRLDLAPWWALGGGLDLLLELLIATRALRLVPALFHVVRPTAASSFVFGSPTVRVPARNLPYCNTVPSVLRRGTSGESEPWSEL